MKNKKPAYEEVVKNLNAYYGVVDFLRSLEPMPRIKFEGEPGTGKIMTFKDEGALASLLELKPVWEDNPDIPPPPVCPVRLHAYRNCFGGIIDRVALHPIERLAYDMWSEQYALWHKEFMEYMGERTDNLVGLASSTLDYIKAKTESLKEGYEGVILFIDEAETLLQGQEEDNS